LHHVLMSALRLLLLSALRLLLLGALRLLLSALRLLLLSALRLLLLSALRLLLLSALRLLLLSALHLLLLGALRLLLLSALRLLLLIPLHLLLRRESGWCRTICAGLRRWSPGRLVLLLPRQRLPRILFRRVRALLHILCRQVGTGARALCEARWMLAESTALIRSQRRRLRYFSRRRDLILRGVDALRLELPGLPELLRSHLDGVGKSRRSRQHLRPHLKRIERMPDRCCHDRRLDAGIDRKPSVH
jgi:hypothetical protein